MNVGRMRHRIEIQQDTGSQDSTGQVIPDWDTFAERWALVEVQSGSEPIVGEQVQASRQYKITLRYLDGVTSDMRILWNDRTLEITSVVEDAYKRQLILTAGEYAAVS